MKLETELTKTNASMNTDRQVTSAHHAIIRPILNIVGMWAIQRKNKQRNINISAEWYEHKLCDIISLYSDSCTFYQNIEFKTACLGLYLGLWLILGILKHSITHVL